MVFQRFYWLIVGIFGIFISYLPLSINDSLIFKVKRFFRHYNFKWYGFDDIYKYKIVTLTTGNIYLWFNRHLNSKVFWISVIETPSRKSISDSNYADNSRFKITVQRKIGNRKYWVRHSILFLCLFEHMYIYLAIHKISEARPIN